MRLPKVWLIWLMLAAFVAIFLLMELAGGSTTLRVLIQFGATTGRRARGRAGRRLISRGMLHIGVMHLLMNGWGLIILGKALEEVHGPRTLWALFILPVLGGSITSNLTSTHVSAGASGGLFGLIGAYVVYASFAPVIAKAIASFKATP